jgi:hypothetical protein
MALRAFVETPTELAFSGSSPFWEERRLLKAAALYADSVDITPLSCLILLVHSDVRRQARLGHTSPRVRFRSVVNRATKELMEADCVGEAEQNFIGQLRINEIDPAVQEIDEELDALGARRTLMRLASDHMAVSAAAAQLSLFAGVGSGSTSLAALMHGALSGPLAATAAKEADFRAELRGRLRRRPLWLLYDVGQRLNSRSGSA